MYAVSNVTSKFYDRTADNVTFFLIPSLWIYGKSSIAKKEGKGQNSTPIDPLLSMKHSSDLNIKFLTKSLQAHMFRVLLIPFPIEATRMYSTLVCK